MRVPTYYKALDASGRSCHGGSLAWSLPAWSGYRWTPGAWMPKIDGDIIACSRGYHACNGERQLLDWLWERTYVIESRSRWIDAGNKVVTAGPVRLVRGTAWDDRTARLFAVACALDVPPLYEAKYPDDPRVQDALIVSWEYANGHADDQQMAAAWAAARDAARAAARAAAWDAARAAAWAAARDAAWAAARDAAWDAARAAARAAAWAAARDAQSDRLARYLVGDIDI